MSEERRKTVPGFVINIPNSSRRGQRFRLDHWQAIIQTSYTVCIYVVKGLTVLLNITQSIWYEV